MLNQPSINSQSPLQGVYPVSIAPMMKRTDRHFRYFMRGITKKTLLYTEMITSGAIIHGNRQKLLGFDPVEHPIALQVGGNDATALSECARIAEDWGYDEINLNVGCPSDRVQNGHFGASLMARPDIVAQAVEQMSHAVSIPVTVKHRIGIDNLDRYQDMKRFVSIVSEAGCKKFTIHARKAWLTGLNPKENRTIPPLRYNDVFKLKEEMPHLTIEINGGIKSLSAIRQHLSRVDAAMIGRAAYDDPFLFLEVDRQFFHVTESFSPTRLDALRRMLPYIETWLGRGQKFPTIGRHLLNCFVGQRNGKLWRRYLTENGSKPQAGPKTIEEALHLVFIETPIK